MEDIKPKSVKAVGIGIIAVSILALFGNGFFILTVNYAGGVAKIVGPNSEIQFPGLYAFWNHLYKFSLLILLFSFLFIAGGILLLKFNRWARIILTALSIIFSIVVVVMTVNLVLINFRENLHPFGIIAYIFSALR